MFFLPLVAVFGFLEFYSVFFCCFCCLVLKTLKVFLESEYMQFGGVKGVKHLSLSIGSVEWLLELSKVNRKI